MLVWGYRGSAACFTFCFPCFSNGPSVNAALEIRVLLDYFFFPLTLLNNNTLLHKLPIQVNLLPVIWIGLEKYSLHFYFFKFSESLQFHCSVNSSFMFLSSIVHELNASQLFMIIFIVRLTNL